MKPLISVIVPTYRRDELLQHCLERLRSQEYAKDDYEIIVVDDGRSDATRAMVNRIKLLPGSPAMQYVQVFRRRGPAAARNTGIMAARGRFLAFTDDDCLPCSRWLSAGTAALNNGAAGATGRIIVPVPPVPTDHEENVRGLEVSEFATANSFYRRSAVQAVGGFDERFTAAWREDADLFFSVLRRFGNVAYVPEAVVVHPVRSAPWGVSVTEQRKSMFNALLFKKHPGLFRHRIRRAPPWNYYTITTALLAAAVAGATGNSGMLVGAALVWSVTTTRFCHMRLKRTSHSFRHIAEMITTSILLPPVSVFWRLYGSVKFRVLYL